MNSLIYTEGFTTENGHHFGELEIAYNTWGSLNKSGDNVIWVCHALTANSDVAEWWPGMLGKGLMLDTDRYFIVCANILGSCYGTTGPLSINPETGHPWYLGFPEITTRDCVHVHDILRRHLGISRIAMVIGASIGGHQALEYSLLYPELIERLVFIASNAKQSPWAIAFNESQRLAIEADPTFYSSEPEGGTRGLKAARSIALLSYRNGRAYNRTQEDKDQEMLSGYSASSYQCYQGEKLVRRFNVWSYYRLTGLSDSYNVGRGRGGVENALRGVRAKTITIGISSDILFPPDEVRAVANKVPNGEYFEIDSFFGHDGFLIESEKITNIVNNFISEDGSDRYRKSANRDFKQELIRGETGYDKR